MVELELELIKTHMTQKPVLWVEVRCDDRMDGNPDHMVTLVDVRIAVYGIPQAWNSGS